MRVLSLQIFRVTLAALSMAIVLPAWSANNSENPASDAAEPEATSGLTAEELAVEASVEPGSAPGAAVSLPLNAAPPADEVPELLRAPDQNPLLSDYGPEPVDIAEAKRPLSIKLYSEIGYENADGQMVLDLLEQEYLYLSVLIDDANGAAVNGAVPTILTSGSSKVVPMAKFSGSSGENGVYPFGLTGGQMGVEELVIVLEGSEQIVQLNVVDLKAAGYSSLAEVNGAIPWSDLMQAKVSWGDGLAATFPPQISEQAGKTVKLTGFMMPLEMEKEQRHFILTSNPPSCFFHIPGGPAGAVEVFAAEPVSVSWEPVVLEGRFEPLAQSDEGTVYRLHDAKMVEAR